MNRKILQIKKKEKHYDSGTDYKAWISFHIHSNRDPSKLERARRKILRLHGVLQGLSRLHVSYLTVA
jgi:hypothetical protein